MPPRLDLGSSLNFDGSGPARPLGVPAHHLVTHAVAPLGRRPRAPPPRQVARPDRRRAHQSPRRRPHPGRAVARSRRDLPGDHPRPGAHAGQHRGRAADLASLLDDLESPPVETIGALAVDDFVSRSDRRSLAASLNALLASPSVATWREGASVDVGAWLTPIDGRTPAVIVSVAHLDEDDRALVLGMLLDEVLAWVRGLSGTSALRALIVFDEVYGFLPPHPSNPPTKRPLVALMKQARAYGVGVVLATQNPMDLDYRALSNAGMWFVGRLQTDADRARVVDGMAGAGGHGGPSRAALAGTIKRLGKRWFVVRDVHAEHGAVLVRPRWAITWMKGPMTRPELRRAVQVRG